MIKTLNGRFVFGRGAACATIAGLALLSAVPTSANGLTAFSFSYVVGQTYRYHLISSMKAPGRVVGAEPAADISLRITSESKNGWRATQTYSWPDRRSKTTDVTIAPNGVWTRDGDSVVMPNFVSFDPSAVCAPPDELRAGLSWSCTAPGFYLRPSGNETVTVTKLSAGSITLDVRGASPRQSVPQPGQDVGQTAMMSHMSWHDVITYEGGRQVRVIRDEVTSYSLPGTSINGRDVVHEVETSD